MFTTRKRLDGLLIELGYDVDDACHRLDAKSPLLYYYTESRLASLEKKVNDLADSFNRLMGHLGCHEEHIIAKEAQVILKCLKKKGK